MTRINLFRNEVRNNARNDAFRATTFSVPPATLDSVAWGKINFDKTTSTLVFAALLIVCSIAVGCSSDKPKSTTSDSQPAMASPVSPATTTPPVAPVQEAAAKPAHKRVHKAPATLAYTDKDLGVSFQYPRKYMLKTGDAANELVSSDPVPMDFVQPGGVAVAMVALPDAAYPNSDLAAAFFNVSVNKSLTAEQCAEFSEAKPTAPADPAAPATVQPSKLIIGDMELASSENTASQGTREEASKYYHVFGNGACYEFALKVATTDAEIEGGKHVDRDEVFQRLKKILATVKINPVAAPEVTASAPTVSAAPATPAQ
jgi:hypothetical protein